MIEWRDEGTVLAVRKHGETSAIVELFTPAHGRAVGVVRGASSRRMTPLLQKGAHLDVTWKARLEEHLGHFTIEPIRSRAALVMGDRLALAGLNAVTALLSFALPERDPHPRLYHTTMPLLDLLGDADLWPYAYLKWELMLLEDLGFGLDLSACAVTGARADLVYVSPKSGRAVSRGGAGEWANRLLPLPPILCGEGAGSTAEVLSALGTTGHFLHHHLAPALGTRPLPPARQNLLHQIAKLNPKPPV